jgi:glycosyltransferase involved in cell wall biosynthesis
MTGVAFLVDQLFAAAPGGMGTYVRELVPALSRADPSLHVTLFHARFGRELPEDWMRGFPVEEIPFGIRRLYPEWAALRRPKLPPRLGRHEILHSPSPAAVPPATAAQRLVVTIHDIAFLVHPKLFPTKWRLVYRAALSRAVRNADAIITVSRHTAEDLVRRTRVDPRRIHPVHLGVVLPSLGHDPRGSEATAREAGAFSEVLDRLKIRQPYILFVGTLEPRKNLVRLVRAYRRVAAAGTSHSLVLAGPIGWHHESLLRETSLQGPGEVVLTGASRSAGELDALYRGADAFAYPSLYEGFGLPVVEAMARGVPCVVSTASSLPEVAGEAALFVDPRSVVGIAEALERVTTDGALRDRLREAGVTRASRFSWDETARRTLDVYKSVL